MKKLTVILGALLVSAPTAQAQVDPSFVVTAQKEIAPSVLSIVLKAAQKMAYYHPFKTTTIILVAGGYVWHKWNNSNKMDLSQDELFNIIKKANDIIYKSSIASSLKNIDQIIHETIKKLKAEQEILKRTLRWYHHVPASSLIFEKTALIAKIDYLLENLQNSCPKLADIQLFLQAANSISIENPNRTNS